MAVPEAGAGNHPELGAPVRLEQHRECIGREHHRDPVHPFRLRPQPEWVEWVAMVFAAYAFAVLFKAHRRDYFWVMAAAIAGYSISRYAGQAWGSPVGIFLSALVLTAAGNAFARWANRPGAFIRVPGILILVPGSTSLRGLLTLVQQPDVGVCRSALLAVTPVVIALIAVLLCGHLLISSRK